MYNYRRKNGFSLITILLLSSLGFGQSIEDIKSIKSQLEKMGKISKETKKTQSKTTASDDSPVEVLIQPKDIADYYENELIRLKNLKEKIEAFIDTTHHLDYFGYDYFTKRDSVFFTDNIHVSQDYIVGAGDEIIISIWGDVEIYTKKTVGKNGSFFIEHVGQIYVKGKPFQQVKKIIRNTFSKKYSTLSSSNPTTFMDVSLGKVNPVNIHLLGAVNVPGIHLVHANSTLITALIQGGGIEKSGSLRSIQVIRNGSIIAELDLYKYLMTGSLSENIQILNQDVIFIPNRLGKVAVDGAINRPAYYELKEEETFQDIISMAGELESQFNNKVFIHRNFTDRGEKTSTNMVIEYNENTQFRVQNGDSLYFRSMIELTPQITIRGQVIQPGDYTLVENMRFLDALIIAGGFQDSAFIQTMDLSHAELVSRNKDSRFSDVRRINIERIMRGDDSENYLLSPWDEISIFPNRNYLEIDNVYIGGEIIFPGTYTMKQENMSLNTLILRAGGFTGRSFEDGIHIYRDTLKVVWNNMNFNLFPGDSVFVPSKPGVIYVKGEVYNPGYIEFNSSYSLKRYIDSGGGFTPDANKRDIIVIYPNGDVKRKGVITSPHVKEGSIIVINKKPYVEPVDWASLVTTTASLTASVATVLILLNQTQGN